MMLEACVQLNACVPSLISEAQAHEQQHNVAADVCVPGEQFSEFKPAALATSNVIAIASQQSHRVRSHSKMQSYLGEAVKNCSEFIGMADREGCFTFANQAFIQVLGYSKEEEVIGKLSVGALLANNPPALALEIGKKSFEDEGWSGECHLSRRDGSSCPILLTVGPVRDNKGRVIGTFGVGRDITDRKAAEEELRRSEEQFREVHSKLKIALGERERQVQEAVKLTELVDILQSCQTAEEASKIIGNILPTMLCSRSGAFCITSSSRNVVEVAASWGDTPASEKTFAPDSCWALRRGRIHRVNDPASPLRCAHVSKSLTNGHICIPLAAQGETLGVLCVENCSVPAGSAVEPESDRGEVLERQITAVGERISLALANLRLREVLRAQSIRDPLTGLFNRRFMEESLERELRRAMRGKEQVALLMMDIDHFKHFNDTFGHQAGDALLRALGNLLKESVRGQDIVCRYGGEEFVFVLPGASLDAALKRAELLREDVKQLNAQYGGQLLGAVTLSIGIAVFPDNGDSAEHLLKAADDALYRAKAGGRDRVIAA